MNLRTYYVHIRRPDSGDLMTSLMRGMTTTSRLVGKLHSMRAHQSGGGGSGLGMGGQAGSMDMEDDKWDWMTGVPTSIRYT